MKLSKIILGLDILELKGDIDIDINQIDYDSRNLKENSLFICISGFNIDAHTFINDAIKKGSKAFLVEKDIYIEGYTFIRVKNTREAMAKIATNFYDNPSEKLDLIGVTGTNGKTSITHIIKEILDFNNKKTGLIGTIKNVIGDKEIESSRTTPESIELQRYFVDMVDEGVTHCIMEVSSHSLKLNRVDNSNFKVGIFTNLTKDHLDFHPDMEDYKNAKKELFYKTSIANIINIDDFYGQNIYDEVKQLKIKCITYAIDKNADFKATNIKIYPTYVTYNLVTKDFTKEVLVNIPGRFTVYNTLSVIGCLYMLGMDIDSIIDGLKRINGVPGRFETIKSKRGFSVIVDYAHTPDALENILNTANEFTKGKIITVVGCGGNRDKTKRPIMGAICQKNSDYSIITSDNPRKENPNDIIKDILTGLDENAKNYEVIIDRREAIKRAISIAKQDDIVIIAGKGHENYQIINDEKMHFDDKEEVINSLEEE